MTRSILVENGIVTNIAVGVPDGYIMIPDEEVVDVGWGYEDGNLVEPPAPAPTVERIIAERNRRLAEGFDHDFGDSRGQHRFATTEADMKGWDEVTKAAAAYMAAGQPDMSIFVVTETGPVTVTALDWQSVLISAHDFRQPIWIGSFNLQEMEPIPQDFDTNETYWTI